MTEGGVQRHSRHPISVQSESSDEEASSEGDDTPLDLHIDAPPEIPSTGYMELEAGCPSQLSSETELSAPTYNTLYPDEESAADYHKLELLCDLREYRSDREYTTP